MAQLPESRRTWHQTPRTPPANNIFTYSRSRTHSLRVRAVSDACADLEIKRKAKDLILAEDDILLEAIDAYNIGNITPWQALIGNGYVERRHLDLLSSSATAGLPPSLNDSLRQLRVEEVTSRQFDHTNDAIAATGTISSSPNNTINGFIVTAPATTTATTAATIWLRGSGANSGGSSPRRWKMSPSFDRTNQEWNAPSLTSAQATTQVPIQANTMVLEQFSPIIMPSTSPQLVLQSHAAAAAAVAAAMMESSSSSASSVVLAGTSGDTLAVMLKKRHNGPVRPMRSVSSASSNSGSFSTDGYNDRRGSISSNHNYVNSYNTNNTNSTTNNGNHSNHISNSNSNTGMNTNSNHHGGRLFDGDEPNCVLSSAMSEATPRTNTDTATCFWTFVPALDSARIANDANISTAIAALSNANNYVENGPRSSYNTNSVSRSPAAMVLTRESQPLPILYEQNGYQDELQAVNVPEYNKAESHTAVDTFLSAAILNQTKLPSHTTTTTEIPADSSLAATMPISEQHTAQQALQNREMYATLWSHQLDPQLPLHRQRKLVEGDTRSGLLSLKRPRGPSSQIIDADVHALSVGSVSGIGSAAFSICTSPLLSPRQHSGIIGRESSAVWLSATSTVPTETNTTSFTKSEMALHDTPTLTSNPAMDSMVFHEIDHIPMTPTSPHLTASIATTSTASRPPPPILSRIATSSQRKLPPASKLQASQVVPTASMQDHSTAVSLSSSVAQATNREVLSEHESMTISSDSHVTSAQTNGMSLSTVSENPNGVRNMKQVRLQRQGLMQQQVREKMASNQLLTAGLLHRREARSTVRSVLFPSDKMQMDPSEHNENTLLHESNTTTTLPMPEKTQRSRWSSLLPPRDISTRNNSPPLSSSSAASAAAAVAAATTAATSWLFHRSGFRSTVKSANTTSRFSTPTSSTNGLSTSHTDSNINGTTNLKPTSSSTVTSSSRRRASKRQALDSAAFQQRTLFPAENYPLQHAHALSSPSQTLTSVANTPTPLPPRSLLSQLRSVIGTSTLTKQHKPASLNKETQHNKSGDATKSQLELHRLQTSINHDNLVPSWNETNDENKRNNYGMLEESGNSMISPSATSEATTTAQNIRDVNYLGNDSIPAGNVTGSLVHNSVDGTSASTPTSTDSAVRITTASVSTASTTLASGFISSDGDDSLSSNTSYLRGRGTGGSWRSTLSILGYAGKEDSATVTAMRGDSGEFLYSRKGVLQQSGRVTSPTSSAKLQQLSDIAEGSSSAENTSPNMRIRRRRGITAPQPQGYGQHKLNPTQITSSVSPIASISQASSLNNTKENRNSNTLTNNATTNWKVGKYSITDRLQRLAAFVARRRSRKFTKSVSYEVRKALADTRLRHHGRFVCRDDEALIAILLQAT